ncbi:MAG: MFS transporter [Chloroflexi bacterium]|nr:MFS transporter [Chloroflexota bacterium]MCL5274445.1 MFS transporter [Chloroflexota bacterium]
MLLVGRIIMGLGSQMLSFAIGWELWLRTHDAFALGLVGLAQVTPVILFSLPAGHVADQYNRKRIVLITQCLLSLCSLALAMLSLHQGPIILVYVCLFGIGLARAFNGPATSTLLPQTVPPESFTSAATWSSSAGQLSSIIGPALAGALVALLNNVTIIYVMDALAGMSFLVMVALIRGHPLALSRKAATLDSLKEGVRFIRTTKVILAAITLDLFAVLFGGAVTLLPIYATDILKVGPEGLGLMRAAPSVGALIMAIMLAYLPAFRQAGRTLLIAVAGFGIATIIFGISTSFWLSMLMLLLLGGLDNISVVIRSTLMLTLTPDEMRGRTSAVNSIFISASNELGGFESGLTAALFGPILSVVGGGIGTILVVLAVARIWPQMRRLKTLDAPDHIKAV